MELRQREKDHRLLHSRNKELEDLLAQSRQETEDALKMMEALEQVPMIISDHRARADLRLRDMRIADLERQLWDAIGRQGNHGRAEDDTGRNPATVSDPSGVCAGGVLPGTPRSAPPAKFCAGSTNESVAAHAEQPRVPSTLPSAEQSSPPSLQQNPAPSPLMPSPRACFRGKKGRPPVHHIDSGRIWTVAPAYCNHEASLSPGAG